MLTGYSPSISISIHECPCGRVKLSRNWALQVDEQPADSVPVQIVLTIHQPSSDICERFDDLILLSCGRMLYCGPWGDADNYFASAGFE